MDGSGGVGEGVEVDEWRCRSGCAGGAEVDV